MKNLKLTGLLSPVLFVLFMLATFTNIQSVYCQNPNDLDSLLIDEEQQQLIRDLETARKARKLGLKAIFKPKLAGKENLIDSLIAFSAIIEDQQLKVMFAEVIEVAKEAPKKGTPFWDYISYGFNLLLVLGGLVAYAMRRAKEQRGAGIFKGNKNT